MYELRDKATQEYLDKKFPGRSQRSRDTASPAEVENARDAFEAGWIARKAAQYSVAHFENRMHRKRFRS